MHYQKPAKVLKTFSTLQEIMKSNENGKCILKNIKQNIANAIYTTTIHTQFMKTLNTF